MHNGLELSRLGLDHRQHFQHFHHTTFTANRAASQVASSDWLGGNNYYFQFPNELQFLNPNLDEQYTQVLAAPTFLVLSSDLQAIETTQRVYYV